MNITPRRFLAYTLLPQMGLRFRSLLSGFNFIAFFLAQVYRTVGLLPPDHPYLLSANIGRYGLTHVMGEAGLLLKQRNAPLDQKIIYWLLMLGLIILFAQFGLLFCGVMTQAAHAAPVISGTTNFFITTTPANDLAFMLLDRVFGVPNLFNSCVATNALCLGSTGLNANEYWTNSAHTARATLGGGTGFPSPFHQALHSVFQLYSVALLCIGAIILIYFIGAVIAETAESGTPFGRRFNHVWAPMRLVLAIGLLVPMANGLNAAQYITLYAAKFGSGFATNGWTMFVNTAVTGSTTMLGAPGTLIAKSTAAPVNSLLNFFALVATCKHTTEGLSRDRGDSPGIVIQPYLINPKNTAMPFQVLGTTWNFAAAATYEDYGNIMIRFGEIRMVANPSGAPGTSPADTDSTSNVTPTCGEIVLPVTNVDATVNPGALYAMEQYFQILHDLWNEAVGTSMPIGLTGDSEYKRHTSTSAADPNALLPTTNDMVARRNLFSTQLQTILTTADTKQQASSVLTGTAAALTQYGWAGAGIWYNRIAQINGSLMSALYNLPTPTRMPQVMEDVSKANASANRDTAGPNRYRPYLAEGQESPFKNAYDGVIAVALSDTYTHWLDNSSEMNPSSNILIDLINATFGTTALFDMRNNQAAGMHPLAQIVAIGKGIMENSEKKLFVAGAAGLGGGVANLFGFATLGSAGLAISSIAWSVAMTAMSIGFVLYYVVPFLPFIYFFFAVSGWIKSIFEAMVGVPLWALAHLRIDGQGLPGEAAMGGYYLILDVFLRPILIIFGMLGGIMIFTAQASILNDIWSLVTSNVTGFNHGETATDDATGSLRYLRDSVDQLFYTVMYAIVVYMMAMSSFKMVDQVPNYVLRWMGSHVETFGQESNDHPGEHLISQSFQGASQVKGMMRGASPERMGQAISGLRGRNAGG